MKGKFTKTQRKGLPGGPNEVFTYTTGVFSTQGYKRDSPDVNNPFNIIPSGDITMKGVDFRVLGTDNLGNSKMMTPGNDYKFPGDMVFELPMAKDGLSLDPPSEEKEMVNLHDFLITEKDLEFLNSKRCFRGNCLENTRKAFDATAGSIWGVPYTANVWGKDDLNITSIRNTPTEQQVEDFPWMEGDRGMGTADSWDIQGNIVRAKGKILYNRNNEGAKIISDEKEIDDPTGKFQPGQYPIGSIYSFGPKNTPYTNKKERAKGFNIDYGLQPSHHSVMSVGVNEKGEIILYDAYLKKYDTEENIKKQLAKDLSAGGLNYELETVGVPKSYAELTPGNIKASDNFYRPRYFTEYQFDVDRLDEIRQDPKFRIKEDNEFRAPRLDKGAMQEFTQSLKDNKETMMEALRLTSDEYDDLANLSIALAMAESEGGGSLSSAEFFGSTQGLTQLDFNNIKKDDALSRQLAMFNESVRGPQKIKQLADLRDPAKSAIATLIYTNAGKKRSRDLYQAGLTPGVRNFYDSYSSVLEKSIKNETLPKAWGASLLGRQSGSKITDDGIYLDELNDRVSFSDIPGWNEKDVKKISYHLNLLASTNEIIPNRYQADIDEYGDVYIKMKTLGNDPSMSDAMKVAYWWQSPTSLKTGDAQGGNVHAKRIEGYYKAISEKTPEVSTDNLIASNTEIPEMQVGGSLPKAQIAGELKAEDLVPRDPFSTLSPAQREVVNASAVAAVKAKQERQLEEYMRRSPGGDLFPDQGLKPITYNEEVSGWFPVAGEYIDAKNTGEALMQGDYVDAGFNAAGLFLPFIPGSFLKRQAKEFLPEIDLGRWGKFNEAIPDNKILRQEYAQIEKMTKANNTWMKNPDGSPFKGTPEQFVQQQSENFKRAFPNGFDITTRGDHVHYETMRDPVTFSGDKHIALQYTYANAQPFTRNSPLGRHPNPPGPGFLDSEGLYELYYPIKNNTLKIDGKGYDFSRIPVDDEGLIEYMKGKQVWSDDIAEYIQAKDIDRAIIDNIYDDSYDPGRVLINNNKPGNYLKSIWGNDGMFDMTNPNIYKRLGGSLPKAQDGKEVPYGSPEYRKAYREGRVQGQILPEIDVVAERPNYAADVQRAFGAFVTAPFASAFNAMTVPQALAVEQMERMRGRPYNYANALDINPLDNPVSKGVFGTDQRLPSQALEIENPVGAFALDAFTDPLGLIGGKSLVTGTVRAAPKVLRSGVDLFHPVGRDLRRIKRQGVKKGLSPMEIKQQQMRDVGITSEQRKGYFPGVSELATEYYVPYGYHDFFSKLAQVPRKIFKGEKNSNILRDAEYPVLNSEKRLDAWKLYSGMPQKSNTFKIAETFPVNHPSYSNRQLANVERFSLNNDQLLSPDYKFTSGRDIEDLLKDPDKHIPALRKMYKTFKGRDKAKYFEDLKSPSGKIFTDRDAALGVMGGYNQRFFDDIMEYNDIWDLRPGGFPVEYFFGKPFLSHGQIPFNVSSRLKDYESLFSSLKTFERMQGMGNLRVTLPRKPLPEYNPVPRSGLRDPNAAPPPSPPPPPVTRRKLGGDIVFAEQTPKAQEGKEIYKVKSGDTFLGIANRLEIPREDFIEANPDINIDKLSLGQKLNIPVKKPYVPTNDVIPSEMLWRQAFAESNWETDVENKGGYKGLGQIGDDVITDYKKAFKVKEVDPFDPVQNSTIHKWYMNKLYNSEWVNKPNQDPNVRLAKALVAYNWGPKTARKWFTNKKKAGVDIYNSFDWLEDLPSEPKGYIDMIIFNKNTPTRKYVEDLAETMTDTTLTNQIINLYKIAGGEMNKLEMYNGYINGEFDGTDLEPKAQRVYDRMNRVYYAPAKKAGMSPPNFIMTNIIPQQLQTVM